TFRSITMVRDGGVLGFSLRVPEGVTPTCDGARASVSWEVVLRVDGASLELRLPVRIGAYARRAEPGALQAAAAVGSAHWRGLWQEAAARHGLVLHPKRLRLEGA